eukprot:1143638-Pelagomonas_calceolata.AAC.9
MTGSLRQDGPSPDGLLLVRGARCGCIGGFDGDVSAINQTLCCASRGQSAWKNAMHVIDIAQQDRMTYFIDLELMREFGAEHLGNSAIRSLRFRDRKFKLKGSLGPPEISLRYSKVSSVPFQTLTWWIPCHKFGHPLVYEQECWKLFTSKLAEGLHSCLSWVWCTVLACPKPTIDLRIKCYLQCFMLLQAVQKATNLPHQSAYSKALVATLLTREECAAQNLHLAMKGLGTDERAMIQILAHSTKEEVELIKVGRSLANVFWYWCACHDPDPRALHKGGSGAH